AFEDRAAVAEGAALRGDGPAIHAEPQAIRASSGLGRTIVHVPDLDAPRVIPIDPLAVDWIAPILLARQIGSGFVAKLTRAVFAIADAFPPKAAPAIVRETLRVAALDNLGENSREILVVVRAVHASYILISGAIRIAAAVAREPVRVRFEEV